MSQISDSFLQQIAAGSQMLGQAGQNVLGQQQIGLQQAELAQRGRAMQQEERMQQRQLGAQQQMQLQEQEAQRRSYADLNASRERMQSQEIEASRLRQQEQQEFARQQNAAEQKLTLHLQQLQARREKLEAEAAAAGDDQVAGIRQQRMDIRRQMADVKSAIAALQTSYGVAQGVQKERLDEFEAQMQQFQEAVRTRHKAAMDAVAAGFNYAGTLDALQGGFIEETARLGLRAGEDTPLFSIMEPLGLKTISPSDAGVVILFDNVISYFTGVADKDIAFKKATEFARNGGAMAAQTVYNAFDLNGNAFGLEPGKKQEAAAVAAQIIADASILANVDPRVSISGRSPETSKRFQEDIAKGVQKLRDLGMGDEQIAAVFDGLESMSSNRAELMTQFAPSGGDAVQAEMMNESFKGVGKIADAIQGVISNEGLMQGRTLEDLDKFDWSGAVSRGRAAYGMGQSSELAQLMSDMKSLGMSDQELMQLSERLIASDPRLQTLRPEEFLRMIEGMARQQEGLGLSLEELGEEMGIQGTQTVARGRAAGAGQLEADLAALAGLIQ